MVFKILSNVTKTDEEGQFNYCSTMLNSLHVSLSECYNHQKTNLRSYIYGN